MDRASVAGYNATVIGKVTELLQHMRTRSKLLQEEANRGHAEVKKACEESIQAKQDDVAALVLQIDSLEARLRQLDVEITDGSNEAAQNDFLVQNSSMRLRRVREDRASQSTEFARDLTEYNAAVGALDRALDLLAKEDTSGVSFLARGAASTQQEAAHGVGLAIRRGAGRGSIAATAVADAVESARRLRQARRYQPDIGGMAKDEHLFDEFEGLTTATGRYVSQSSTVESLLTDLKTAFVNERETLMNREQTGRVQFEAEEKALLLQIDTARTGAVDAKGALAADQSERTEKQQELVETELNRNSTEAYLSRIQQACQERNDAYTSIKSMRAQEVEAVERAIAILTGEVATHAANYFPALLRMRTSPAFHAVPRKSSGVQSAHGAEDVLGFLRIKASKLQSSSLGRLAEQLGELLDETSSASSLEDPLLKVKDMIRNLIQTLQASSTEEASHKAWCDAELAENENAQETAKADVSRHEASVLQLQGNIQKLAVEVEQLNASLDAVDPHRAALVANRSDESALNLATVEDADESVRALESAILILQEYYANASGATMLLQQDPSPRARYDVSTEDRQHGSGHSTVRSPPARSSALLSSVRNEAPASAPSVAVTDPNAPLPDAIAQAPVAAAALSEEGRDIIAMLEVAADNFRKLASETRAREAKALQVHKDVLLDHDVMVTAAESDRAFKMDEQARLQRELDNTHTDLNASSRALTDAAATYENLKAPCLDVETYEERKLKRDEEIAALREAYDMLEEYAQQYGQSFSGLLQQRKGQSGIGGAAPAPAPAAITPDPAQLETIARLLDEIRTEVAADLADDTQVNEDMKSWCASTVSQKQSAIADATSRQNELETEIETSAQEIAKVGVQLQRLREDIDRETASLEQRSELRDRAENEFRGSEVELVESIVALRSAIEVLARHYNDTGTTRDLDKERDELEAEKTRLNLTSLVLAAPPSVASGAGESAQLVSVAAAVKRALGAVPGSDVALASISPEQGVVLRAFLARPGEILHSPASLGQGHAQAALVTRGVSALTGGAVDGGTVYGILKQLLENFQADLAAAREHDRQDRQEFDALEASKVTEIEAMRASVSTKQEQLAHYSTVNADAKEDYAYNGEALKADTKYLNDVLQQCAEVEREFEVRHSTRKSELEALDEAIDILTAGAGVQSGTSSTFLLHHHHAAKGTGRVFLRSHGRTATSNASVVNSSRVVAAAPPQGPNQTRPTREVAGAIAAAAPPPLPSGASALAPAQGGKNSTLTLSERSHAARKMLATLATRMQVEPKVRRAAGEALATIAMQTLTRLRAGPLTRDALATVASRIDSLRKTLLDEKQLEIRMHDTCVNEDNQARQQRERRISDEAQHNATRKRLDVLISGTTGEVEQLRAQIAAINSSIDQNQVNRLREYDAFRLSVQEQRRHQATLHEAIRTLRAFYTPSELAAQGLLQLRRTAGHAVEGPVMSLAATAPTGLSRQSNASAFSSQRAGMTAKLIRLQGVQADSQSPAPAPPARQQNRVNRTAYKVTPLEQSIFSRPLQRHEGSMGIIGILGLLVEESEALVEAIVRAEEAARDGLTLDLNDARATVDEKERQIVVLQQTLGNANAERQQVEADLQRVATEVSEIDGFLDVVTAKCSYLFQNFTDNQEARDAELENLMHAKATLLGMLENPTDGGGAGAAAALQIAAQAGKQSSPALASTRRAVSPSAELAAIGRVHGHERRIARLRGGAQMTF